MSLQFERGDRQAPMGHALVYFRGDNDSILAAYVTVPPIRFDPSKYLPGIFAGMMQEVDLGDAMAVIPTPPIPEEVASVEHLQALSERRRDDLLYGGAVTATNPMQLAEMLTLVAREYAEAYEESLHGIEVPAPESPLADPSPFAGLSEQEQLKELTMLTGRLQDSLLTGGDPEVDRLMRQVADLLPAKYRARDLVEAAHLPGEQGRALAGLYLERCYKLLREDYLDLERIDREIEALRD